ncbi:leucine-rich repeat-containing protein 15-like [Anneissia japonica]|uniref:leucine-rich repeat-containing protein 15-like n=1 Tax=Anneissia japonica TaxID=1529436 RepID=UPI0014259420|nr:leucine-rich repeat-containing protein 15-like [Anneissia japonica]
MCTCVHGVVLKEWQAYVTVCEVCSTVLKRKLFLSFLDLSSNKIHILTAGAFNGLKSLQNLYMHSNNLVEIKDNAFQEMWFSLQVLDIQFNKLSKYSENTFRQLKNLKAL